LIFKPFGYKPSTDESVDVPPSDEARGRLTLPGLAIKKAGKYPAVLSRYSKDYSLLWRHDCRVEVCMNDSVKKAPLTDEKQKVFQELYQTHHRRVYSTCLRMTRDASEAEDLTQEIFVHLFRALGSFRGESAFTTWLHRLTVNHVLMHFRKRKLRPVLSTEDGELSLESLAGNHDHKRTSIVDRILLSEVIAKLPNGYREALVLHDIEGFEHKEIAEMSGRSEGTSKSQLHKARRALRALITQPVRNRSYSGNLA
jgi:RNA polymerase sigma-70 factor, ECF subfamily